MIEGEERIFTFQGSFYCAIIIQPIIHLLFFAINIVNSLFAVLNFNFFLFLYVKTI